MVWSTIESILYINPLHPGCVCALNGILLNGVFVPCPWFQSTKMDAGSIQFQENIDQ